MQWVTNMVHAWCQTGTPPKDHRSTFVISERCIQLPFPIRQLPSEAAAASGFVFSVVIFGHVNSLFTLQLLASTCLRIVWDFECCRWSNDLSFLERIWAHSSACASTAQMSKCATSWQIVASRGELGLTEVRVLRFRKGWSWLCP